MGFFGLFKKEKQVNDNNENKNTGTVSDINGKEITVDDITGLLFQLSSSECIKMDNTFTAMGYSFDLDDLLNSILAFCTGIAMTCFSSLTESQLDNVKKIITEKYIELIDGRLERKELSNSTNEIANELKERFNSNLDIAIEEAKRSHVNEETFIDGGISDSFIKSFTSEDNIDKLSAYVNKVIVMDWFIPINKISKAVKVVE